MRVVTLCLLVVTLFLPLHSKAIGEGCHYYLKGTANPGIVRFGAMNPNPLQHMANVLLNFVPKAREAKRIQAAVPVSLVFNPAQPEEFGDGQKNALATYQGLATSPFIAVLTRNADLGHSSELALIFSNPGPEFENISAVEVSIAGSKFTVPVDSQKRAQIPVDVRALGWNKVAGTRPIFFRPVGWNDWFAVQFPDPYITNESLVGGMDRRYQRLPDGRSIIDPLRIGSEEKKQQALRNSKDPEFTLARHERVHGLYLPAEGAPILTSTGGIYTRYRVRPEGKIIYSVFDARNVAVESRDGVVSGTGPHLVRANGEIIMNALGREALMTFYGIPSPVVGPNGEAIAWNFRHQWVATWLQPGEAFITPQDFYHWHLNHLSEPIAVQVLTPPEVPSLENHYGYPKP